ncbi:MAG: hypothetical protein RLP10_23940 [Roseibium album]
MPVDEPVQLSCDTGTADGCVDDAGQTLARIIINDVQNAETPTVAQLVMEEIHAPSFVDGARHDHGLTSNSRTAFWLAFAHL